MNFVRADDGEGVEPEEVEGTCSSQRKIAAKPFARARLGRADWSLLVCICSNHT